MGKAENEMTQQTTENLCYLIVLSTAPFGNQDSYWWVGTIIVVFAAYSLRLMGDIRNKEFTWKSAGVQMVTTISLCSIAYYVWRDAKAVRGFFVFFDSFQIYIFLVSFFSFFIVTTADKIGKYGIKTAFITIVNNWLHSIAATDKNDIKKEVPNDN